MQITDISEAKASLSHLIELVQETDDLIIIGKAGKPVAVLSSFREDSSPRQLGSSWEGSQGQFSLCSILAHRRGLGHTLNIDSLHQMLQC